jgi:hypothetical protein
MKKILMAWVILLAAAVACWAQEHHGAAPAHGAHPEVDASPHPSVSENPVWVRPVVIIIGVMFLVAIPVGWLVRALMPEEMPQTHAHDEHHGHKDPHGDMGSGGHDPHGHSTHH